ncbi:MAG TPA: type II toxin-antitoxin system RelE/ParE family toxin [Polyangiales bacterium]|nr:type II toxin-antitoxin system RelE/ParE family toxin [Polyangiales bacterium]
MTVHYTKRAARALNQIAQYPLDERGPEQRDRYMAILEHVCEVMIPKRARYARQSHRQDLLVLRCDHHVIYFRRVRKDFEVVHVLHERQLPKKYV